MKQKVS
jgi:hypothetical protein